MKSPFTLMGILAVTAVILFGCSAADKGGTPARQQKVQALAIQKYGSPSELIPNATEEFILCIAQEKQHPAFPLQPVRFFVYDVQSDSIVYERALESGTVQWHTATELSINRIPGNITGDESTDALREIYDLTSRRISRR